MTVSFKDYAITPSSIESVLITLGDNEHL